MANIISDILNQILGFLTAFCSTELALYCAGAAFLAVCFSLIIRIFRKER